MTYQEITNTLERLPWTAETWEGGQLVFTIRRNDVLWLLLEEHALSVAGTGRPLSVFYPIGGWAQLWYQTLLRDCQHEANPKAFGPLVSTLAKLKGSQPFMGVGECFKPPAKR